MREPILILGVLIAGGEAAQQTLLHPPTWLHVAIAVAIAVAGALRGRALVTPVTNPPPEIDE